MHSSYAVFVHNRGEICQEMAAYNPNGYTRFRYHAERFGISAASRVMSFLLFRLSSHLRTFDAFSGLHAAQLDGGLSNSTTIL